MTPKGYGKRETIPGNEQFDKRGGKCFNNYNAALKYFDEFTDKLKPLQGVPKSVTGVEEEVKEVFGYQVA